MTIFDYIGTPTCETMMPLEDTWARAANPATLLDGNHLVMLLGAEDDSYYYWRLNNVI